MGFYLAIVRRRWPLVLSVALASALISAGLGLARPARYAASASLLVTRAEDRRFDTEDALAYDLPAIVSGEPFAREVSAELARRGRPIGPDEVRASLSAANARRVVTIAAAGGDPSSAEALLAAAVDVVRSRGMALWGDEEATPERTGLNAVVLSGIPPRAERSNGLGRVVMEAAMRGLVGLGAGVFLALGSHAVERIGRRAAGTE